MDSLRERLADAKRRCEAAAVALRGKHKGGEHAQYRAAHAELLDAERALADAEGEEHAVPVDIQVQWDVGAPLPQLLVNDLRCFLIFRIKRHDPEWDGSYVTVVDPSSGEAEPLALVEFSRCSSAKLGGPNEEVLHGHPLAGKGLDPYSAQVVRHSRWLAELKGTNSVHPQFRADRWENHKHFVFWFHDKTFECVAEKFEIEVHQCSMPALLAEAAKRLLA